MIHYHGTPLGAESQLLPKFYTGRHALISYANKVDTGVILDCCQTFVVDNGAFSFWKSGKAVDWDEYIDWLRPISRHPGFDWWIIPDSIEGTETDNLMLQFKFGRRIPYGVPVYHMHESLDHLENLVNNWPRVAIGSSGQWPTPGTESWWSRMEQIMAVACDSDGVPKCKLHGLRMLDDRIFRRLPLSSADSCNAVINAKHAGRFGMYVPPNKAQCAAIIADRIEVHNSAPTWISNQQDHFEFAA